METSLKELIEKSKTFGFKELPTSGTSEVSEAIVAICKASPDKFWTAKVLHEIVGERVPKYYSDTMWGLAQQGILENVARGVYKFKISKDNPAN